MVEGAERGEGADGAERGEGAEGVERGEGANYNPFEVEQYALPKLQGVQIPTQIIEQVVEPKAEVTTPAPTPTPTPAPAPQPAAEAAPAPEQNQAAASAPTPLFSLSGALSQSYDTQQTPAATGGATQQENAAQIDPQAEEKINAHKATILSHINHHRTRYTPFFAQMQVEQNSVVVEVPSNDIANDMRKLWYDIEPEISNQIAISSRIEIKIVVKEEMKVARPIKLEDRIVHFAEKNPAIQRLVERLEMVVD